MSTSERVVAYAATTHKEGLQPIEFGPGSDVPESLIEALDRPEKLVDPATVLGFLGHDGETHVVFHRDKEGVVIRSNNPQSMAAMLRAGAALCDALEVVYTKKASVEDMKRATYAVSALAKVLGREETAKLIDEIKRSTDR